MVFDWKANYYYFMSISRYSVGLVHRLDLTGVFDWDIYNNMLLVTNKECNILPIMLSCDNLRGASPLHSYVCVVVIYYILFVI